MIKSPILRNFSILILLGALVLGGGFFIICALMLTIPLTYIMYKLRVQDHYVKKYLIGRFAAKLGLRSSMRVATCRLLDDWQHCEVTIHDLALRNPDNFSDSIMATAEIIKVEFLPETLLTSCLTIRLISVQGVDAYLERVDGKLNTSAVAIKKGEEPPGGAIVVWSDNSEESDSSDDDLDGAENSGLKFGKAGRAAADKAVQVAKTVPRAAVQLAGSAVKKGIQSVTSGDGLMGIIQKGRGMVNRKKKDESSSEGTTLSAGASCEDLELLTPSGSPYLEPMLDPSGNVSLITEDHQDMSKEELEEMWLSDTHSADCGADVSKRRLQKIRGAGMGVLRRLKGTLSKRPAAAAVTVNDQEKPSAVPPQSRILTVQEKDSCSHTILENSQPVQPAPPAPKLPADKPMPSSTAIEKPDYAVKDKYMQMIAEKGFVKQSSGISRIGGSIGDISRRALRTLRQKSLTETPYEEVPGQRFGAVERFVISNVRLHVAKLLNAAQQQHQQATAEGTMPDIAQSKPEVLPLFMNYIVIEGDDLQPAPSAIRQEGIPPKELARRIKIKVRGALRRQNRAAMVRLGAARGMEWLRTRVKKRSNTMLSRVDRDQPCDQGLGANEEDLETVEEDEEGLDLREEATWL